MPTKKGLHAHDCLEKCQDIQKICSKCNKSKFLIDFRIDAECVDGHLRSCKECRYNTTFQQNRDATKKLYERNKVLFKSHNCETEGCEKLSKFCNFCQTKHTLNFFYKDKGLTKVHRSMCRVKAYAASAKTRNLEWKLPNEYAMKLFKNRCIYCNADKFYMGIDRVNNSLGYIDGNVVPCCTQCNKAKLGMSHEDYIKFILHISSIPQAHINRLREAIS